MKKRKFSIQAFYMVLLVAITFIVVSCTNEMPDDNQNTQTIRMILEGGLQEYDDAVTRATTSFPNGAKLMVRFANGAYATATYSTSTNDWSFTPTGTLSSTSSAECTLYYSPSPKSVSSSTMTLDSNTPLYTAQGNYSYSSSSSVLKVTATLTPSTPRVRFKGYSGTTISLSGLTYYNSVDVSKSSPLSSTSSSISLTVSGSYTDYVYGYFADSNRELKLTSNSITYKRTIESTLFTNGKSGYVDIPTSSTLGKWEKVEHEYVDLGLTVMWATCNVGASSPEDYGDYYAWGETETKDVYDWSTYKLCDNSYDTMNKYCTDTNYGTVDNKIQLDPEDDVVHVKWGGSWRMPTSDELFKLESECTWTWDYSRKGYKVTSKRNGNSIFLPAAGYRNNSGLERAGGEICYWSSSLYTSYSSFARCLNRGSEKKYNFYRYCGGSIRPVCPNKSTIFTTSISLNQSSLELTVGETSQLYATVSPSDASNKSVTWTSNNSNVATISSTGLVTAKAIGSATITATAADGSGVKATCSIKVKSSTGPHDYVDLGLSVKWATCNVGASSPEDYGDYYAWGEIETKKKYSWNTYKWCNGTYNSLTKYCTNSSYGYADNKQKLDPEDDVAHVKWGDNWRMPTDAELNELRTECTWTWDYAKKGYTVVSKKNGKSIFLPTAGYYYYDSRADASYYGYYWASTVYTSSLDYAWYMRFNSGGFDTSNNIRCYGHSVRPVCP